MLSSYIRDHGALTTQNNCDNLMDFRVGVIYIYVYDTTSCGTTASIHTNTQYWNWTEMACKSVMG